MCSLKSINSFIHSDLPDNNNNEVCYFYLFVCSFVWCCLVFAFFLTVLPSGVTRKVLSRVQWILKGLLQIISAECVWLDFSTTSHVTPPHRKILDWDSEISILFEYCYYVKILPLRSQKFYYVGKFHYKNSSLISVRDPLQILFLVVSELKRIN